MSTTMPYDERDDSGRFSPTHTDEEFIDTVREQGIPSTSDVAEALDCNYRTAYDRLKKLEEQGDVRSRQIGNSLAWEVPISND